MFSVTVIADGLSQQRLGYSLISMLVRQGTFCFECLDYFCLVVNFVVLFFQVFHDQA
jgi:hypothetical protein